MIAQWTQCIVPYIKQVHFITGLKHVVICSGVICSTHEFKLSMGKLP